MPSIPFGASSGSTILSPRNLKPAERPGMPRETIICPKTRQPLHHPFLACHVSACSCRASICACPTTIAHSLIIKPALDILKENGRRRTALLTRRALQQGCRCSIRADGSIVSCHSAMILRVIITRKIRFVKSGINFFLKFRSNSVKTRHLRAADHAWFSSKLLEKQATAWYTPLSRSSAEH